MNKMTKIIAAGLMLVAGLIAAPAQAATPDYLSFTAVGGDVTIGMEIWKDKPERPDPAALTFETSSDPAAETWDTFTAGTTTIALADGETVYFRRSDDVATTVINTSDAYGWRFAMSGTGLIDAGGNAMSLLDKACISTRFGGSCAFYKLFSDCANLRKPPALPATKLMDKCYGAMFSGCTSLLEAPTLPATTLTAHCYSSMFLGCTSLTAAPALPATELAPSCYSGMFNGCVTLAHVPDLSHVTALTNSCYSGMFQGCTALTESASLSQVTTVAEGCCQNMFYGCSVLTNATIPSATELAKNCYNSMYYNCVKVPEAPELSHVTTVAEGCCQIMFYGCSVLTNATVPSATELAKDCYN